MSETQFHCYSIVAVAKIHFPIVRKTIQNKQFIAVNEAHFWHDLISKVNCRLLFVSHLMSGEFACLFYLLSFMKPLMPHVHDKLSIEVQKSVGRTQINDAVSFPGKAKKV